ncbi:Ppx/GppA phosphatase family protein [Pseudobacteriovorax antillogorgiicola]|uniref:Exopolyphosphatase / guanosine-5'-triphosphate,3'-diphosphate pyrophosphatase n=1 Tax=Pseudobacteriovorax antillogorgiicola TaxID=1513793 RepID=A0A1Y6B9X7_9BACT|nr:Ppx/GppA phosphatase family protein [Pseudobacteriovorax antillogorgiicola]TCS59327.1 exopolyphosphatase/guanosine-5'-triphosphate,3'-diphosphate pyrophosphatase [Pseudobacteriovorax antillogorgiicola]SME89336.1 exopolyphosphatase / guanosine-5'-triphosphate,3'-diphosphate pyrophosphatase [Pseudobacteriovorax antillogorgiicola]
MGTNSFHLLVARADQKGYLHVLDAHKESVRLGEALSEHGALPKAKLDEAVAALKRMKDIANKHQPVFRVMATQATRAAKNYQEILERIDRDVGLKVEIIDGLEEARLTYLGMQYCHESTSDVTLGLDIGGGSTEVVIGKGERILFMTSLKLGALTSTKRFFQMKDPSPAQIKNLKDYILTRLAPLGQDAKTYKITRAFATSGTAKAIGRLHHLETQGEALDQANGYKFLSEELGAVEQRLCDLASPTEIKSYYEIDSRRAEIILAGTLIFSKVTEIFGVPDWTVSTYGIREGIILDTYGRLNIQLNAESANQQWKSMESFAQRLHLDLDFANQLRGFSLEIFDQCLAAFPKSQLPSKIVQYRPLLEAAAYLNESGKFINFVSYHKHSYYLISQANLLGFSQEEKHVVALINRFARKKMASEQKADEYPYLKGKIDIVNFLSACIRVAKGINRSRSHKITETKINWAKGKASLELGYKKGSNVDAEIQALRKEEKSIARGWGVDVELKFSPRKAPKA